MMKVTCDHCSSVMKLNYVPRGGETIKFKCKSANCDNTISVSFPINQLPKDATVLSTQEKPSNNSSCVELTYEGNVMQYPLKAGINIIGRKDYDKFPDICLNVADNSLSRLHCMIEGVKGETEKVDYILKDYKSKNGVYLNGRKLSKFDEVYLDDQDEIYMSKTKIVFVAGVN